MSYSTIVSSKIVTYLIYSSLLRFVCRCNVHVHALIVHVETWAAMCTIDRLKLKPKSGV
jgi:hypothetical protein